MSFDNRYEQKIQRLTSHLEKKVLGFQALNRFYHQKSVKTHLKTFQNSSFVFKAIIRETVQPDRNKASFYRTVADSRVEQCDSICKAVFFTNPNSLYICVLCFQH